MHAYNIRQIIVALTLGAGCLFGAVAHADADLTLGLDRITNNSTSGDAIANQLSIEVFDTGPQLQFLVSNLGPEASNVVRFYWHDAPAYLNFSTLAVESGWAPFSHSSVVGASTTSPQNGLSPGESASFSIGYATGANFSSFLSAIQTGDVELRLHVRDIDGNLRETYTAYVSEHDNVIAPVPTPLALGLVGVACVVVAQRRSRFRTQQG